VKHGLVTGAAGLIGFELTRQLLEAGSRVTAVDIYIKGGQADLEALQAEHGEQLTLIVGDLSDSEILTRLPQDIDTIYHLAAIVGVQYVTDHPYETMRTNMLSTIHVLDHARQCSCQQFVFASSSENYASAVENGWAPLPTPETVPLVINDIALPRWSYAASKISGEAAVLGASREHDLIPTVLRFHNVYGPRMGLTHVIPELLDRAIRRVDPFPVYGHENTRTFLHVQDAARAIRLIVNEGAQETDRIFNIGSTEETPISKLVDLILEISDHHPELEIHPAPEGSVNRRVPETRRLAALGFSPEITLEDGLSACYRG
jgi:UDP-glucose 4-epimerase/UDP-glucuronate decarboxylase